MTESDKAYKKKVQHLKDSLNGMNEGAKSVQRELFLSLIADLVGGFVYDDDGLITLSDANIALISKIDPVFELFQKGSLNNLIVDFANSMVKVKPLNEKYYRTLGFKAKEIKAVSRKTSKIKDALGLTKTGRIKAGTYLHDLTEIREVRNEIRDYITSTVVGGNTNLKDFTSGLKERIVGRPGTDGRLQKYYSQKAYDEIQKVDEIVNEEMAIGLGLEHFIYLGGIIKTSRQFCRDKNGKVFSVVEAKRDWPKDKTLVFNMGKNPKGTDSYVPLRDRGGPRCRHRLRYITLKEYLRRKAIEQS